MMISERSRSVLLFSVFALSTAGLPSKVSAMDASQPSSEQMTPESAEAMARHYEEQAVRYRGLGGVAYKTGLVQAAEREAAKYANLAAELQAPARPLAPRSPDAAYWAHQVDTLKRMGGGVAYKTGLLARAEAELRKYEPVAPLPPPRSPEAEYWARQLEAYKRMGGVAYKTGLVAQAEAELRKADAAPSR